MPIALPQLTSNPLHFNTTFSCTNSTNDLSL